MAWQRIAGSGDATVWVNPDTGQQYVGSSPPPAAPSNPWKTSYGRWVDGDTGYVWILDPQGKWIWTGEGMADDEDIIDNTPNDPLGSPDRMNTETIGSGTDFEVVAPSSSGTGRRYGGSGASGPTYRAPDEGLVRSAVRGELINLLGRVDDARLDMLVSVFMNTDKANFNSKTQAIDPMEAVREKIRVTDDYARLHKLRPEEIEESQWVSSRQAALIRAGLTEQQAVELGIQAAQTGMTTQQAVESGQISEFARTGQARFGLEESIARAARAAFRVIR